MNKNAGVSQFRFKQNRYGLIVFLCLSLATVMVLATTTQFNGQLPGIDSQVKINTRLSQHKLVKGEQQTVYLEFSIDTPQATSQEAQKQASDIVVVLDRSGSMSGANKMNYAKTAIENLLSHLNANDRFALISFSNNAIVHSGLVPVDSQNRDQLIALTGKIRTGGGTAMSDGLQQAVILLKQNSRAVATKVILLSDGHANQGITDINGLSQIVRQLTEKETVLSSIGMGLDFNETLMSALADYGMGSYDYLENLTNLGEVFNHQLDSTRTLYAAKSHLNLNLADGVTLLDSAGYPVERDGNTVHIKTGQLLQGAHKHFTLTFKVTPDADKQFNLASLDFNYALQGREVQHTVKPESLAVAVVEPQKRQEAVASIDKEVYQQSWLKNNLGRMRKQVSGFLRSGEKNKADQVISEYRDEVSKAELDAAMPIATPELKEALNEMESSVDDAFRGNEQEKKHKQKRAAKAMQYDSLKDQRAYK